MPPKPTQTQCWPPRAQYMRRTTGRVVVRHRRDATRQRRRSASNLSVQQERNLLDWDLDCSFARATTTISVLSRPSLPTTAGVRFSALEDRVF